MIELLSLLSHHKLLKNLGALSENAKCIQRSNKIYLTTLYPVYDGMAKKTISRYCLFKQGRYSTVTDANLMVMAMSL
jgi:hypothetical protein